MSAYIKNIIPQDEFYIVSFTKDPAKPYVLFIHGGPGYHSGIIEYLVEYYNYFSSLDYNILLYDQRNCGRSPISDKCVIHEDNINDLHQILQYLNTMHIKISCLIGHSYGAKLLFDACNKFDLKIPSVFVSTADSILTPRLNNLIMDLSYLKKTDPNTYKLNLEEMNTLNLHKLWGISEKLTPLFQENPDRTYLYWANIDCMQIVTEVQKKINLAINAEIFVSVRKDLYSNEENFSVNIKNLRIPKLWINGFHDYIMNGSAGMLSKVSETSIFYKSAHYPHIEENERFSQLVNEFLKINGGKYA